MQWPWGAKKAIERRRSPRVQVDCLNAVYWEGSANCSHRIREMSLDGAFIETPVDWIEGTLIRLNLRATPPSEEDREADIFSELWCRVVRRATDGFCVEFLFFRQLERDQFRKYLERNGVKHYDETSKVKGTIWQRSSAH